MEILVTGAAGFIGFHVAKRLLEEGKKVLGVDNLIVHSQLKRARLNELNKYDGFDFSPLNIADRSEMETLFSGGKFPVVIHLAAQAGVRVLDPTSYGDSNLIGFLNVLEGCRNSGCEHLIYASSSSVYGSSTRQLNSETDHSDEPLSLYAATKKSNELMAHAYHNIFGLSVTGLRFFTVYGPWGRPDMAMWLFARAIEEDKPIKLFNNGSMKRDFTYIDDTVEAIVRMIDKPSGYRICNVGTGNFVDLLDVVELLEAALGKKAIKEYAEMQPGDVLSTRANIGDLKLAVGFYPRTTVEDGIPRFVDWFKGREQWLL